MSTENNKEVEKRISDTINSLEGLGKAQANPFFFTRLEARMEEQSGRSPVAIFGSLKLSVAVLTLFMVLNVVSVFLINGNSNEVITEGGATLETFSEEYFSEASQYNYTNSY